MPSRREMISMSAAEIWDFINSQKNIQVCTLNKDGSPHLTSLWFAVVDNAIILETFSKSQKIKNLERDPRIGLLLEDGEDYNQLRGVSINATAELVTDYEKVHQLHTEVIVRNQPGLSHQDAAEFTKDMCYKKTAIIVKPEKVFSWDHRKLDVSY